MTRVSENSTNASVKFALNKTKQRLEDLQMKGSTLKSISRPSDNPMSNVEALQITSVTSDNKQYMKNADYALLNLNVTEKSIEQITEILQKAKEIAIQQSSDFYDAEIRKNVANEIVQLRNQALAIANKRVGQRYIFGGHKSLTKPFNENGEYLGDKKQVHVEVSKDFFVPINLNGYEIFYSANETNTESPIEKFPELENVREQSIHKSQKVDENGEPKNTNLIPPSRDLASEKVDGKVFTEKNSIFGNLDSLIAALENNDSATTQALLERFDDDVSRLITLRTRVGSIANSVNQSRSTLEANNVDNAERKSKLLDADIAELFSDLQKQQAVLKTSYQASKTMLNQNLLDFLR